MNFFLKAKHWQLFSLMVLLPMLAYFIFMGNIFMNVIPMIEGANLSPDPLILQQMMMNQLSWFPVMMVLFTFFLFSWLWTISVRFQEKIPERLKMNLTRFKILFFIPLIYILFISFGMLWFMQAIFEMGPAIDSIDENMIFTLMPLFMILHIFSIFCIFHTLYFAAKTIKLAEVKKPLSFGDFVGEFFLLWFYIIGVWFLQPKINKIFNDEIEEELSLEDNLVV